MALELRRRELGAIDGPRRHLPCEGWPVDREYHYDDELRRGFNETKRLATHRRGGVGALGRRHSDERSFLCRRPDHRISEGDVIVMTTALFAPILGTWLAVYIVVWTVRWVRRGFAKDRPDA